jgi:TPR repeat protein
MNNPDIEAQKKGHEAWEEGIALRDAGRVSEAIEAFKVAAESGNAAGYIDLASIEDDRGNYEAARNWMRKAKDLAIQGDAFANLACSLAYRLGRGYEGTFEEQEQKAQFFLRRSAELGNPAAQIVLANNVLRGVDGETQNEQEYEMWILRAIGQGVDDAVISHVQNMLDLNRTIEPALVTKLEEVAAHSESAKELLQKLTRVCRPGGSR